MTTMAFVLWMIGWPCMCFHCLCNLPPMPKEHIFWVVVLEVVAWIHIGGILYDKI